MKVTFAGFRKDKFFFLKYFSLQMVITASIAAYFISRANWSLTPELSLWHLLLLPFAFAFGVHVPVMLHNAVHFNIKPRWLNELLGEMCGFFVLFGMGPFRISHVLHHAHPDDKDLDPHPPMGKGFLYFVSTTQMNTIRVIGNLYFSLHGKNAGTYSIMGTQMACYYVGVMSRIATWYLLLGPTYFVAFYLPAFATNLIVFAHINFATHKTMEDGTVEIVNLNHNLYYKVVNVLSSGAYYHRNHHLKPNLYNPSLWKEPAARPVVVESEVPMEKLA